MILDVDFVWFCWTWNLHCHLFRQCCCRGKDVDFWMTSFADTHHKPTAWFWRRMEPRWAQDFDQDELFRSFSELRSKQKKSELIEVSFWTRLDYPRFKIGPSIKGQSSDCICTMEILLCVLSFFLWPVSPPDSPWTPTISSNGLDPESNNQVGKQNSPRLLLSCPDTQLGQVDHVVGTAPCGSNGAVLEKFKRFPALYFEDQLEVSWLLKSSLI